MGNISSLILEIQIKFLIIHMENYDLKKNQLQISDPIESYFECISSCDTKDGNCISRCVEILKKNNN